MVTDLFGVILQELGPLLQIKNLHPDRNNSCEIKLVNGTIIQIELDKSGQFLVLGTDFGMPAPGKYRESLFKEALRANGMPAPIHGIIAYSSKADHLVMFEKIHVKDLSGAKVAAAITPFVEKAIIWTDAVRNSQIPAVQQVTTSSFRSAGMFGLRP